MFKHTKNTEALDSVSLQSMDLFTHQILPFLLLLLCGSVGGFLAGLLGVGGGMLFIPVINEYLSSYPLTTDELVKYTLANSIALVFMSGFLAFSDRKNGHMGLETELVYWYTRCREFLGDVHGH